MNNIPPKDKLVAALEELRYRKIVRNQTDFGNQLGYSKSYFSNLMNGGEIITDKVVDAISTKYGFNRDWFYGLSDEMFLPVKATPTAIGHVEEPRQRNYMTREEIEEMSRQVKEMRFGSRVNKEPWQNLLAELLEDVDSLKERLKKLEGKG